MSARNKIIYASLHFENMDSDNLSVFEIRNEKRKKNIGFRLEYEPSSVITR